MAGMIGDKEAARLARMLKSGDRLFGRVRRPTAGLLRSVSPLIGKNPMSKTQLVAFQEGQAKVKRSNAEIACEFELTILMPCLNEAETLATCIRKATGFLARTGISGEVLIADNGSTDGSPQIAEALGARVVLVRAEGLWRSPHRRN